MPGAMPSGRLPPAPIKKVPMQDDAAVAVISERLVRSKQSLKPAMGKTQRVRGAGLHLQPSRALWSPQQPCAEVACTCVGWVKLAAGVPPGGAAAVVGRARAAAVCQDLGIHCQNVRHCSHQTTFISRQLPFIEQLESAVLIAVIDMQTGRHACAHLSGMSQCQRAAQWLGMSPVRPCRRSGQPALRRHHMMTAVEPVTSPVGGILVPHIAAPDGPS